jgi:hypothetical protein
MKHTRQLAIAFTFSVFFAGAADATVYTIEGQDVPPGMISGTITTDGVLGVLTAADIISTDLTVKDGSNTVALDGSLLFNGTSLTATSTGLFFDYSPSASNYLVVFDSSQTSAYCIATGSPTCLGTANNEVIEVAGLAYQGPVESSEVQIAATSGVPEPSTWAMMLLGFAGLSFAGHRRSQRTRLA